MGDEECGPVSSKKRVAGRQLTKDNPEHDDDGPEPEMGTFKKASEEVMATRRIVKVRRNQPSTADSSNPFAGIRLVPPSGSTATAINATNQPQTGSDMTTIKENDTDETSFSTDESKETKTLANVSEVTEESGSKFDVVTDATDDKVTSYTTEEKTLPVEASEENGEKIDVATIKEKVDKDQDAEEKEEKVVKEQEAAEKEEKVDKDQEAAEKEAGDEAEKVVKEESEKEKQDDGQKDKTAPFSSFQQLSSSQNAFTGFTGTGFSTSFAFASFPTGGSTLGASSGSFFGSSSSFGAGSTVNGSSSTLVSTAVDASQSGKLSLQEVPVETGEENEKAIFTADAILYEYLNGGWKERGKGELKLNVSVLGTEKARLVMRSRGNFRLILNACLFPEMSLASMDKRGFTFACVNSAGDVKDGLATFALKFKDSNTVEVFQGLVMANKGKKSSPETPQDLPERS